MIFITSVYTLLCVLCLGSLLCEQQRSTGIICKGKKIFSFVTLSLSKTWYCFSTQSTVTLLSYYVTSILDSLENTEGSPFLVLFSLTVMPGNKQIC